MTNASSRRDAGYFAFRFKGTPAAAAASLEKLLADVLDAPIDETRLARAREERIERLSSDWISRYDVPLRVLAFLGNGDTEDPRSEFLAKFKKLGKADLEQIIAELRTAPRAITIWGNVAGLDHKALAKHGEIVELTVAQLLAAYTPKPATPAPVKKRAKPAQRKRR